jgi:hypothetical protein
MERVKKEHKKKIMDLIEKAGNPENYEVSWSKSGIPEKVIYLPNKKRGTKSRAKGANFELKVRKDLEKKGRIVDKWTNNVDLEKGKLIIARKYNPFKRMIVLGTGFPDFISIKRVSENLYSVIGVEVKINGILSKEEKEKCFWYLKEGIFSSIWIAKKADKEKGIEYIDFRERYIENNKT